MKIFEHKHIGSQQTYSPKEKLLDILSAPERLVEDPEHEFLKLARFLMNDWGQSILDD